MKKNKSLENYYENMRRLSGLKENTSVDNSTTTLVEHAKTNDGTILGIVKDAHHYYIKKTTSKDSVLNESHFVFVNGVQNKNDYRYNSLGDAQKQLNLVIKEINEAFSKNEKISKSKKQSLNEDKTTRVEKPFEFLNNLIKEGKNEKQLDNFNRFKKSMNVNEDEDTDDSVEDAIDTSINTLDKLDDKIKSEPEEKEEEVEQDLEKENDDSEEELDLSDIDVDDSETEEEAPDDDSETVEGDDIDIDDLDLGDDEETKEEDTSDEGDTDDGDLNLKELEKLVGKLTYKIRALDLTPDKTKSFMNSILASFESDLSDVDLEDKKEMSNKILKAEKNEDDEEISEDVMEDDVNQTCEECKTFENYLSERGYEDTSDVTSMEMANVISDYIDDNEGELDDETLTEIAKHCKDDVIEELKEYGHLEECDKLQPFIKKINEEGVDFGTVEADVDDMEIDDINEISWGGVKKAGQYIKDKTKSSASNLVGKIKDKFERTVKEIESFGDEIIKNYNKGNANEIISKIEKISMELGDTIKKYNDVATKAGGEPIKIKSIMNVISNKLSSKSGQVDLSNKKFESYQIDEDSEIEVVDDEIDDMDMSTETPEIDFSPAAETLGVNTGSRAKLDVNLKTGDATISLEEQKENQIRKYIRNRIEEKFNGKKSSLNESKKSAKIKKLDEMIDKTLLKLTK